MEFAVVQPMLVSQSGPLPSETATEGRTPEPGTGETGAETDPRSIDPKLVAKRVYDLMEKEIRLARIRGQ